MKRTHSIAMVAACPFPANYGSPAAIRELSVTLAERGNDVHVVTYPHGDDLPVGNAKLHRVSSPNGKKPRRAQVGPSLDKANKSAQTKLTLVRELYAVAPSSTAPKASVPVPKPPAKPKR